jgi:hypothetical protein
LAQASVRQSYVLVTSSPSFPKVLEFWVWQRRFWTAWRLLLEARPSLLGAFPFLPPSQKTECFASRCIAAWARRLGLFATSSGSPLKICFPSESVPNSVSVRETYRETNADVAGGRPKDVVPGCLAGSWCLRGRPTGRQTPMSRFCAKRRRAGVPHRRLARSWSDLRIPVPATDT